MFLIQNQNDYQFYPILLSSTTFFGNLVLLILVVKKHMVSLLSINIKEIKLTLRKNFPLFLNQFVPNLYNNSGVVVIGLMTSSTQVGMYDLLKKPGESLYCSNSNSSIIIRFKFLRLILPL